MNSSNNKNSINFIDWPSYRQQAAYRISVNVKRWRNGYKSRQYVKQLIWLRYNKAAKIIQNFYRNWRMNSSFILLRSKLRRLRSFESYRIIKRDFKSSYKNILNNEFLVEDKIAIWQLVIELRKAHGSSTDNAIKALIDSKGDLARAITLLGIPAYSVRYFDELPIDMKDMFCPTISTRQLDEIKSQYADSTDLNGSSTGIQGIRALRQKYDNINMTNTILNEEFYRAIANTVESAYFSKRYYGSKYITSKNVRSISNTQSRINSTDNPKAS